MVVDDQDDHCTYIFFVVFTVETVETFEQMKYCSILNNCNQCKALGFKSIEIKHIKLGNSENKVCTVKTCVSLFCVVHFCFVLLVPLLNYGSFILFALVTVSPFAFCPLLRSIC